MPRSAATGTKTELPIIPFANRQAWAIWLADHHAGERGVWVKIAKKGSPAPSISYREAVEVAVAWGWIDGQGKGAGEGWWLVKFTPRGPRSIWSQLNRERALALIAAGEMRPPGLAEVERAKRDGRWKAAYASPRRMRVPRDLTAALARDRRAAASFAKLDARNRYAILFRLQTAKKPETRAARITRFVQMLARGEALHPAPVRPAKAARAGRKRPGGRANPRTPARPRRARRVFRGGSPGAALAPRSKGSLSGGRSARWSCTTPGRRARPGRGPHRGTGR